MAHTGRVHKEEIPASRAIIRQALELLERLRQLSGSKVDLFPAQRKPTQPMARNALNVALHSLGFSSRELTPHGFRATASTLLSELGWRSEAIERQLAQAHTDRIRGLYNHAQYLPERRAMMQAWGNYLDQLRRSSRHC